ncbi:hypothetical protein B0T10DRAFT_567656 [Thelonectria olida]|uniref:Uncharacterized protein n=1 Tax=Thelonectria olida TaxID=1576542 RepID=A0A9P8VS16_9HYPO|nr:hypothetical protein B0T10DRAFT_567656 [Thelonectria olida]
MDDEENGLFNIQISDDDDDFDERQAKEARRTGQSEEAWRAVQRDYRPKVENGNIEKNITLPISHGASKPQLQELLHAVEEMYFFRQYEKAVQFVSRTLDSSDGLDPETRQLLVDYQETCQQKLKAQP